MVCPRSNSLARDQLAALEAQQPSFSQSQIIWIDHPCLEDSDACHREFLQALNSKLKQIDFNEKVVVGPYVVTPRIIKAVNDPVSVGGEAVADLAQKLTVYGDSLASTTTKSWLHNVFPHEGHVPRKRRGGVRVPRGYLCNDAADLHLALALLQKHGVESALFKPSFACSGMGIEEITCPADIDSLPLTQLLGCLGSTETRAEYGYDRGIEGAPFILEEKIRVAAGLPSPVVQALGARSFPCCDQVLEGHVHMGNAFPSRLPPAVGRACEASFAALRALPEFQHLSGFWGVDYVVEEGTHEPVLVDLNMARPNGNHFNLVFRSFMPHPSPVWTTRKVYYPQCKPAVVVSALKQAGVSMDADTGCGAWVLSFVAGQKGRVFVGGNTQGEVDSLVARVDEIFQNLRAEYQMKC